MLLYDTASEVSSDRLHKSAQSEDSGTTLIVSVPQIDKALKKL